ncbi:hypothetical protein POM88_041009 [Heracleum sosnowskyi]|uniref:Uncharacterized protein n=1 Tax=Heracleum sosnowskyi TaxID=360622 RepID=A0AAD8MAZ3_9APIA|nr:hypothetical protein POM88_041009 [Heracleum sosnowskyi]
MKRSKSMIDALQNEMSNASSSYVERVIVHGPSNFFVDLRMFENDYAIDYNDDEERRKDKNDEDEDELSDNDDLSPSKKKVRVNKGKARRNSRTSEEDRMEGVGEGRSDSDEESYVDGSNEMQVCNMTITYERKSRSSCEGDYPTKPPTDAKPTIDLLNNGKGLMAPKPKHTLTHIVRLRWDENTLNTKGVKREAFYSDCIKEYKVSKYFTF